MDVDDVNQKMFIVHQKSPIFYQKSLIMIETALYSTECALHSIKRALDLLPKEPYIPPKEFWTAIFVINDFIYDMSYSFVTRLIYLFHFSFTHDMTHSHGVTHSCVTRLIHIL